MAELRIANACRGMHGRSPSVRSNGPDRQRDYLRVYVSAAAPCWLPRWTRHRLLPSMPRSETGPVPRQTLDRGSDGSANDMFRRRPGENFREPFDLRAGMTGNALRDFDVGSGRPYANNAIVCAVASPDKRSPANPSVGFSAGLKFRRCGGGNADAGKTRSAWDRSQRQREPLRRWCRNDRLPRAS